MFVDFFFLGVVIVVDKWNNFIFYVGFEGIFYCSLDGGVMFLIVVVDFRSSIIFMIVVVIKDMVVYFIVVGEVWVFINIGFFCSIDYGFNYVQVGEGSIINMEQFVFGFGEGGLKWNIYVFGYGLNGLRLYVSLDNGELWVDIQGL